ncbi:MAG: hypothetical protein IJQ00_13285 [Kiritimatiellae bacterium]|nr:hypothetical protein [Kiritimatiellia bacterium]
MKSLRGLLARILLHVWLWKEEKAYNERRRREEVGWRAGNSGESGKPGKTGKSGNSGSSGKSGNSGESGNPGKDGRARLERPVRAYARRFRQLPQARGA